MNRRYTLFGDEPVPEPDLLTWAKWYENDDNRHIARDTVGDDVQVSTVFLGLDHNFYGAGAPILYETMVFGGPLDQEQERYSKLEEAQAGHREMLERAKAAQEPKP